MLGSNSSTSLGHLCTHSNTRSFGARMGWIGRHSVHSSNRGFVLFHMRTSPMGRGCVKYILHELSVTNQKSEKRLIMSNSVALTFDSNPSIPTPCSPNAVGLRCRNRIVFNSNFKQSLTANRG